MSTDGLGPPLPPEQQPPAPRPQDVVGAVDLGSPIQNAGRQFLLAAAQHNARAIFMVALTPGQQILTVNFTPDGFTELFGMAILGALTVWQQAQQQRPGSMAAV